MIISGADNMFGNLLHQYSPSSSHHIDMVDCKKKMDQELTLFNNLTKKSSKGAYSSRGKHTNPYTDNITNAVTNLDICMIDTASFNALVQRARKTRDIKIFSILICNIEISLQSKKSTNLVTKLPAKFHNYLYYLSKAKSDLLAEH